MKGFLKHLTDYVDTIYCDMDGVLADFNAETNAVERFSVEKGFFANLKPIEENINAIKVLMSKGVDIKILSASPNAQADIDKMAWLAKYLPHFNVHNVILCRNTDNKAKFAKNIEKSVLIDDYSKNLILWKESGGNALKYVGAEDNSFGTHTMNRIPYIKSLSEIIA